MLLRSKALISVLVLNTLLTACGPKGDNGEPGTPGVKGEQGKDGRDGLKGDTGAAGAAGVDGAKGDKGDAGAAGAAGADGAKGDTGEKGDKGEDGAAGVRSVGTDGNSADNGSLPQIFGTFELGLNKAQLPLAPTSPAETTFLTAPNGDLFVVKKAGNANHLVSLKIFSRASGYTDAPLFKQTNFSESLNPNTKFVMQGNRDILAVTQTKRVASSDLEISILKSPNFNNAPIHFVVNVPSAEDLDFAMIPLVADTDLFAFERSGKAETGTKLIRLAGAAGFAPKAPIALNFFKPGPKFKFLLADFSNITPGGFDDLIVISKDNTTSGTTEVSVLDSHFPLSNYPGTFDVLNSSTILGTTGDNFEFGYDTLSKQLVAVQMSGTASGNVEVSVLKRNP